MITDLIKKLHRDCILSRAEFIHIIDNINSEERNFLYDTALKVKKENYGDGIYLRGLIEFTNYCKSDCFYCGIRRGNKSVVRYRLTEKQILACCAEGYALGMRTFVLQGGEDPYFDDKMCDIVSKMRKEYPDCAITLSIGEMQAEKYEALLKAGANRFLLRHETASDEHYNKLHPEKMTLENRKNCLYALKKMGYQTGAGFMVGSPYQTTEHLVNDLLFLADLKPHMVGIGPFIPHKDTQFKSFAAGTAQQTLTMLALTRLLLPKAMLPSTTALETIEKSGRVHGYLAGANVIMVNISPGDVKENYMLYDNKAFVKTDAQKSLGTVKKEIEGIGMELLVSIGNPAQ